MNTSTGPKFQIRLLGGIGVRRIHDADGSEIEVRSRGSTLLLARVAHPPGQVLRREALIDALFPEEAPDTGRARLRQYLYLLRHELEPLGVPSDTWLLAERETIRLAPGAVITDAGEFAAHVERARRGGSPAERAAHLQAAMAVYGGEFLPGQFDDWVLAQRERLNELYAGALCDLSSALLSLDELPQALECARQAVSVDRLREESHRALMRAFAAAGRPSDAERQFRELERLLREELGVGPSAAARHLREEIRSGEVAPAAPAPAVMPPAAPLALEPPAPPTPAGGVPRAGSSPARKVRLPQPWTRFYGRVEELARIERWLVGEVGPSAAPAPLVTLTGPGGAGKTRLAQELAHRLDRWFGGAVWFVSLETVTDSRGFLDAIAQVLDLPHTVDAPAELIAERLRKHPASLLVLDNFEHLVSIAALEVQELRAQVPGLACLVSSRQRLGVRGEQELVVTPLPVPRERPAAPELPAPGTDAGRAATARPDSPECLLSYPGVQLFVDRAQAARASFRLTAENAEQVAAMCRRLDGLPLALELGAAWLAVLSPQQALDRLSQGLAPLVSRDQDTPERHRSLQAALDSSYLLLPPEHQRLFRRLAVFRDGWTLEAAEAVCGELLPGGSVLEALALLAGRSLVQVEDRGDSMRYRLLETMRTYAASRAAEAGEASAAAVAHARYYHSLALAHQAGFVRAGRGGGADVVEADLENGRDALGWLCGNAEAQQQALELAAALGSFCWIRGRCAEGGILVERALADCSQEPTRARLEAYRAAAWLARVRGDDTRALELLLEARAIANALNDLRTVFAVANSLAGVLLDRRELEAAEHWIRECEVANQTLQLPYLTLLTEFRIGTWADRANELTRARQALERCVALAREQGHPRHLADALASLGWTYRREDAARGVELLREGLKLHREIGQAPMVIESLIYMGALELVRGHPAGAVRSLREALTGSVEMNQRAFSAGAMGGLAAAEAADERWERAALLFGALESLDQSLGGLPADLRDLLSLEVIASARARAAAEYPESWRQGAEMPLGLAISVAQGEPLTTSSAGMAHAPSGRHSLPHGRPDR